MILRTLALKNWLCYRGHHRLELPSGPVAILARYEGQPGRSNWAGKTALLEAVMYALWGWHRKRLVGDVVTWGEKECSVDISAGSLDVVRSRDEKLGHQLSVGVNASCRTGKDAEEILQKVIGMSETDAFSTVVIRQGEMETLTAAAPAKRQEVFAEWLDQSHWERCEKRAREEAREADNKASRCALRLESNRYTPDQLAAMKEEEEELVYKLGGLRSRVDRAKEEEKLALSRETFELLKARAKELRVKLARADSIPDESKVEDEVASIRADYEREARWVSELEEKCRGEFDGRCPVMGAPCPAKEKVKKALGNTDRFRVDLAERKKLLGSLREKHDRAKRKLAVVRQDNRDMDAARVELDSAIAQGRVLKAQFGNVKETKVPIDLPRLLREFGDRERELGALRERIREGEARLDEKEKLEVEKKEAVLRAETLWRAAEVFGRNGIRGAESDEAMQGIEDRANIVLEGTGLAVKFATAREGRKLETSCQRCGHTYKGQKDKRCPKCATERQRARQQTLDILVTEGGRDYDVSECSGGARALVAASLRLGAAWLLRSLRGSPISFLLVDEPFSALDFDNRRLLAQRFGRMAALAGFEQVLVVTHDADLADAMPSRIQIVRSANGDSRVEVG